MRSFSAPPSPRRRPNFGSTRRSPLTSTLIWAESGKVNASFSPLRRGRGYGYPPQLALSRLVNALKGVSSRRLRQRDWPEVRRVLWGKAFWSPSYCVVSCGGAPLDIIRAYIDEQDNPERDRRGVKARARKRERKKDGKRREP